MTREDMIRVYASLTAVHKYLLGFELDGFLYYVMYDGMIEDSLLKLTRMSSKRGGWAKIKIRLSTRDKHRLVSRAVCLGRVDIMNYDDQYNKGDHFERVIVERVAGLTWEKNSDPFWTGGDVVINGEQVQVKFEEAELTNERTLTRRLAS